MKKYIHHEIKNNNTIFTVLVVNKDNTLSYMTVVIEDYKFETTPQEFYKYNHGLEIDFVGLVLTDYANIYKATNIKVL